MVQDQNSAKLNRDRVNRFRDRQRELGRVQRVRWAHPDDWPRIDRMIEKLNSEREDDEDNRRV